AASAVMRAPACGLGSRTSDRFRTETCPPGDRRVARCLLPSAGLAFRPPRVSSPVLSTPAGKLASAAVRRGACGGSASFRNGSAGGVELPDLSRLGAAISCDLLVVHPRKALPNKVNQLNSGDSPVGPAPS